MNERDRPSPRAWLTGGLAAALLCALSWGLGLWPSIGEIGMSPTAAAAAAAQEAPAWVTRLGVSGLETGVSPNPRLEEQLSLLQGSPAEAALRRDLCSGVGMQPDQRFRETRSALVRNDAALCPGLAESIAARSPVVVALGPLPGAALLIAIAAGAVVLGAGALWTAKRRRDRWRLVGRSTFGSPRRAGSG